MEGGGGEVLIRTCRPEDHQQIEAFTCAPYGDKPAKAAQAIIRGAPVDVPACEYSVDGVIAVACDGDRVVGVVVYGCEAEDSEVVTIFSLGVSLDRQREGIGISLKTAVMAEAAARDDWPSRISSEVHRTNRKMRGLNDKLGVASFPDPLNGEYLMTAIAVSPESEQ
jgi:hypothetical protein